jgi:hypothetical protein
MLSFLHKKESGGFYGGRISLPMRNKHGIQLTSLLLNEKLSALQVGLCSVLIRAAYLAPRLNQ